MKSCVIERASAKHEKALVAIFTSEICIRKVFFAAVVAATTVDLK
jgi:hypothetical protein